MLGFAGFFVARQAQTGHGAELREVRVHLFLEEAVRDVA